MTGWPARKSVAIVITVLWVPVTVALMGLSIWWVRETTSPDNPMLFMLWGMIRITPGVVGFMGFVMTPILPDIWREEWAMKAKRCETAEPYGDGARSEHERKRATRRTR